jgi:MFS family permease
MLISPQQEEKQRCPMAHEHQSHESLTTDHEVPRAVHWRNFCICGAESGFFFTAMQVMGPMTLIPFLFKEIGINDAWLGLFTLSFIVSAMSAPLGTALAGGRRHKLPFCVSAGLLQRLPFLAVPLGTMFFFEGPETLLTLLVVAWFFSNFFGGIMQPPFAVLITNGIRERWWARMLSLRTVLGAILGVGAVVVVRQTNAAFAPPHNYVILGWISMALLGVSLFGITRIREIPMPREHPHGWGEINTTFRNMVAIFGNDARLKWIVFGRVCRTCGFVVGTYMTALFIQRCQLTDRDMWIPVLTMTVAQILVAPLTGWFTDRAGVKPAMVVSSLVIAVNALLLCYADSVVLFVTVMSLGMLASTMFMNGWPTLLLKLTSVEQRPTYSAAIELAAAPPSALMMIIFMLMVRWLGHTPALLLSAGGAFLGAAVFYWRLPHIHRAPTAQSTDKRLKKKLRA